MKQLYNLLTPHTKENGSVSVLMMLIMLSITGFIWQRSVVPPVQNMQVRTTQEFIDSLGVVAHLSAQDYPNADGVDAMLRELGITHVRTNAAVTDRPGGKGVASITQLGNRGVKFHFTTPKPQGTQPNEAAVRAAVDARLEYIQRNNLAAYTESLEPFNEYDNSGVKNWPVVLQQANAYLYSQRQRVGDDVKVLGPALIGYKVKDTTRQFKASAGDRLLDSFDYGNIHSYYGGAMPETSYPSSLPSDAGKVFNIAPGNQAAATLESRLRYYAYNISGDKPIVVTETGYNDDPQHAKSVDQTTAGVYMPRAYLENFRIGILRSYAYELIDEPHTSPSAEQHYGLFTSSGTAKPAASSISAMTTLLGGGSRDFTPSSLTVALSDPQVRVVLMQKHPDEYWLALWRPVSVYDSSRRKATPQADSTLQVKFESPLATTYYHNLTLSGVQASPQSNVTLSVGPQVSLLKITK